VVFSFIGMFYIVALTIAVFQNTYSAHARAEASSDKLRMRAGAVAAFCLLDVNGDGDLSKEEMRSFLRMSVPIEFKNFGGGGGGGAGGGSGGGGGSTGVGGGGEGGGGDDAGVSLQVHEFVEMCEKMLPLIRRERGGGPGQCCHTCRGCARRRRTRFKWWCAPGAMQRQKAARRRRREEKVRVRVTCEFGGCHRKASFARPEASVPQFCIVHKRDGMRATGGNVGWKNFRAQLDQMLSSSLRRSLMTLILFLDFVFMCLYVLKDHTHLYTYHEAGGSFTGSIAKRQHILRAQY
jgi:hypothetical protein